MNFQEKLRTYAELLVVHGLNVQKGQIVNISTEVIHRDFAYTIAEVAYEKGARYVNIDLSEPRLAKLRLLQSEEEDLKYVPSYLEPKYRELVDTTAANIRIIGMEDPDLLSEMDPKRINTVRMQQRLALKYFYDEGIGKSKVHWTVAAAATPRWGQKLFPELKEEEANERMWDAIFSACRADKANCLELWQKHNTLLQDRAKMLTEKKIKLLHFKGPGTDLKVGLSERAIFKGGRDMSPRNVEFEPNIPTEEVFTTPDYRVTEGSVQATRPFLVNGKLIENLRLEFKNGSISSIKADSGEETFREYVSSDEGASRLGEVALVGIDSPIFQSGLIFQEILFDENAACHIAVGSAYKFCIEGGDTLTETEAVSIGCNESSVHTDMMISSEEVDCLAETYSGEKIQLINKGCWAI
jgi:aminopeptidase